MLKILSKNGRSNTNIEGTELRMRCIKAAVREYFIKCRVKNRGEMVSDVIFNPGICF